MHITYCVVVTVTYSVSTPGLLEPGGLVVMAPQILTDQLILSQPGKGALYAHHITNAPPPPPGFSDLPTAQEIRRMYGGRSVEMGHLHYSCNEILQVHVRT